MLNLFKTHSIKNKVIGATTTLFIFVAMIMMISIWFFNTLNMITMFQRFERNHTVNLNEAIANFYRYQSTGNLTYFEKYKKLIRVPQSYAYTFARIVEIIEKEGQSKAAVSLGWVFKESPPEMNRIITERVYLLQWHPLVKKLIRIAGEEELKTNEYIEELDAFVLLPNLDQKNARMEKIIEIESFLLLNATKFSEALEELSEFAINLVTFALLGLFVMLIFVGTILVHRLGKAIESQIKTYSDRFEELASVGGDLTLKLENQNKDEMKALADAFNIFLEKLRLIIIQIKESSVVLSQTTETIVINSKSVSNASQKDAASVQHISSALEELSLSIQSVFNESENQNRDMNEMLSNLENLSGMFGEMIEQIRQSQKQGEKITQNAKEGEKNLALMNRSITTIAESSQKINDTIKIITSISEKINLLSLNAAIEAARAGESGKGFVVVADEISKLADQTAGSIKMIAGLVAENKEQIQMGITNVSSASEGIKKVIHDVLNIQKTMESIARIVKDQESTNSNIKLTISDLLRRTGSLKNAISEEKAGVSSIAESMTELNVNSQKNANSSEILLSQTNELQKVSKEILQAVEIFKTN